MASANPTPDSVQRLAQWPKGRRLLLMRHGETYEPRLDSPMAVPDEDPALPLTPRGRERLREVAAWVASSKIEAAYASPFLRARETAEIVAEPQGVPIGTLPELRELPLYGPPGGTLRDVAQRYIALMRDLAERPIHEVPLDGPHTLGAVIDAALAALHDVVSRATGTVLVVAHGGLNRFLLAHWLGMPVERAIAIEQNFACVNVIEFVGSGRPWVRTVNATLHDPLKTSAPGM
jgi:broad specificity phosphatase PhoE